MPWQAVQRARPRPCPQRPMTVTAMATAINLLPLRTQRRPRYPRCIRRRCRQSRHPSPALPPPRPPPELPPRCPARPHSFSRPNPRATSIQLPQLRSHRNHPLEPHPMPDPSSPTPIPPRHQTKTGNMPAATSTMATLARRFKASWSSSAKPAAARERTRS